jgi:hypothetical protein
LTCRSSAPNEDENWGAFGLASKRRGTTTAGDGDGGKSMKKLTEAEARTTEGIDFEGWQEFHAMTADVPRYWVMVQRQANDEPVTLTKGYRSENEAVTRARRWFAGHLSHDENNPTIVHVYDNERGVVFSLKGYE